MNRRDFLKASSLLALVPTVPGFLARTARAAEPKKAQRVLVVVQLDGGNDALNTIVPHGDPNYAKLRPRLKIDPKNAVKLTDAVGLHPQLRSLDKLLQAGHLAAIPGVGYPNPNRSHFRSMAIWNTARFDPEEHTGYGWIGRALDADAGQSLLIGTDAMPVALRGRRSSAVALSRLDDLSLADPVTVKQAANNSTGDDDLLGFVQRQAVDAFAASDKLAGLVKHGDDASYPGTGLGERLKLVSRLLKANLGTRVFYCTQGGFDTHASQQFPHANLLSEFGGAVAAFFADLQAAKLADRVTLLAFSEFGRTIKENASGGTDHGTAGAVFVAGPGVQGGLQGKVPSLTDLKDGEPLMTTDFRRVYATLL
ncbi:MAG: DUF1501 domain-containing protein, partial [Gemmataceae bacterium]